MLRLLLDQICDDLLGKKSRWRPVGPANNFPSLAPDAVINFARGRTQRERVKLHHSVKQHQRSNNFPILSHPCCSPNTFQVFYKKYPRISASISINKYLYAISSSCLFSKIFVKFLLTKINSIQISNVNCF